MKGVSHNRCVRMLTFLAVYVCSVAGGVAQPVQTVPPAPAPDVTKVLTVAIMPFHNEAGDDYKYLQSQIAISVGAAIQQSGRAVIVNRDYVANIVDEKRMAESGVTTSPKQPIRGQMIAADIIAFGRYDVYDGKLSITCELIPADNFAAHALMFYWRDKNVPLQITRVQVEGALSDSERVLEEFDKKIIAAIPKWSSGAIPAVSLPTDKTLAVFDPAVDPDQKGLRALTGALGDPLSLKLSDQLHVKLIDRRQFQALLDEHRLAMAGLSDRGRALTLGHIVGADYILIGSTVGSSDHVRVDAQILDVATGITVAAATDSHADHDPLRIAQQLADQLGNAMNQGLGEAEYLKVHRPTDASEAVQLIRMAKSIWLGESGFDEDRQQHVLGLMWAALDMAPNNAEVNSETGHLYDKFDKLDLAERYYRRSVQLEPGNHWYMFRLGSFLEEKRNHPEEAKQWYQRAMEIAGNRHWNYTLYCLHLSQLLEHQGLIDQAIDAARLGLTGAGYKIRPRTYVQLGKLLEQKGQIKDAAAAYELAARLEPQATSKPVFETARRLLLATDQRDKAMQVLHLQIQMGQGTAEDNLELAQYYAEAEPPLAAELCYKMFLYNEFAPYRAQARKILEDHHLPLQRPVFTGSVFDLDQCRDLGIRVVIQPYEGFRHMRWLPYLKAHLEDVIGIEVVIGKGQREFNDTMYNRTTNLITRYDPTFFSLDPLRKQYHAVAVVGLVSTPIEDGWITTRWRRCLAMTTTTSCDGDYPSVFNEAGLYSLFYPQIAKSFAYSQEIQSWTSYDPVCLTGSCIVGDWSVRELERVPVYCPACRYDFRKRYPNYPVGSESRPPLEMGPQLPAIRNGQKLPPVLLITLGFKPGESKSQVAAHAIEMSTGLPVTIVEQPQLPDLKRYAAPNGYNLISQEAMLQFAMNTAAQYPHVAAVCLWVNADLELESPRWLPWYMRMPGDKDTPKDLKYPIIVTGPEQSNRFTQCELVHRLTCMETVTDPRNPDKPLEVPMYAKYFVAGLATAAIPDHQCWTYGCPTTLWENIGDAARCSYWLCDDCRKALQTYPRQIKPHDKNSCIPARSL